MCMKLSVVIVNYNVKHFTEQCVRSVLRGSAGIATEVFIVDNASTDGSVSYLRQTLPIADSNVPIRIIESNHNLGFARGNNMAIRLTRGEYVLLLNPDTIVAEQTLGEAIRFMDGHPEAGAAGVKMHNSDGSLARESRRSIPTPLVSLKKMLGMDRHYYMSHLPWDSPAPIEVISGAFCLLRRKAIEQVGLLDESFFMYGEDIDLSYRLLKGGWQNWYLPLPILHYKGESTQKSSFRYVHVFYQAMHIFFGKHYGHLSPLITLPVRAAIYGRAAMALCQLLYNNMRRSMGFIDTRDLQPTYLFIGGRDMMAETQSMAARKGLKALFRQSDTLSLDNIETGVCVVCDTSAFSYDTIISTFARRSQHDLSICTYEPGSMKIITPKEIIE